MQFKQCFFDKIACLHKGEQALLSSTPKLKDDLDQPCQVIIIGEIEKSDKSIARVKTFGQVDLENKNCCTKKMH